MARPPHVPPTRAKPKPKPKRVSQIEMSIVLVDEYDALQPIQLAPFVGGPDGTAITKAVAFLENGIETMLANVPAAPDAPAA